MPKGCGYDPSGASGRKPVGSGCGGMASEKAYYPLCPSVDFVCLLANGNIKRFCPGIPAAVAKDGLGNGVRIYGRAVGRLCGRLCRTVLG